MVALVFEITQSQSGWNCVRHGQKIFFLLVQRLGVPTPTSHFTSLHFTVTNNISVTYGGDLGFLQDDGGFTNIPAYVPNPRWDMNDSAWKNVGPVPDLKRNADIMAWCNNQFTARTMNLTTSLLDNQYCWQLVNYAHMSSTSAIKISAIDGGYLDDMVYNVRPDLTEDFRKYCKQYPLPQGYD